MKLKQNISISSNGFVFNANTGDTFKVNNIALEILQFLKQERSEKELFEYILNRYDVDKITLDQHLTDFLNMLRLYQLLE
jgi:hypothetical protein